MHEVDYRRIERTVRRVIEVHGEGRSWTYKIRPITKTSIAACVYLHSDGISKNVIVYSDSTNSLLRNTITNTIDWINRKKASRDKYKFSALGGLH